MKPSSLKRIDNPVIHTEEWKLGIPLEADNIITPFSELSYIDDDWSVRAKC